jgi:hypothetical protein
MRSIEVGSVHGRNGMPARLRRSLLLGPLTLLLVTAFGAAPAAAASTWTRDLYFYGSWEQQIDSRTCTAASVAIMENLIARRDLNLGQMNILRYEQPRDALNNAVQRGSDPLGWSLAATHWSTVTPRPTTYRWEAYPTKTAALNRAAQQLAVTGKPIGLLVGHGTHAIVMTGVSTTANPKGGSFSVLTISISDPDGWHHRRYSGAGSPLNTYLELDATTWYDQQWYGKYVIIVPQA